MRFAAPSLTLVALAGWGATASAEPVPSAPPASPSSAAPDPEALQAALALFDPAETEARLMESALTMTKAALDTEIESLAARDIVLPPALLERMKALIFEEARGMAGEMQPTFRLEAAAIYARYFTAEELRELNRLKANPVMKKAERLSPQLFAELGKIGMKVAAARQEQMLRKATEIAEQWLREEAAAKPGPKT